MVCVAWCMVYGVWCRVWGVECMVYGLRATRFPPVAFGGTVAVGVLKATESFY